MYTIKVLDESLKAIYRSNLEHNTRNIRTVSKRFIEKMGNIVNVDSDSDCITFVTYENGMLAFSI